MSLPHDLSPWGMFLAADAIVKGVLVGLAFASVVTWTVWIAKTTELVLAKRRLHARLDRLFALPSLAAASGSGEGRRNVVDTMVAAAVAETQMSASIPHTDGIRERLAIRLQRIEAAYGRRMTIGTGVLATIGATAPFVGLFGTVWGIMNSFVNIARMQTTNLAVVAPGIAEALLATAVGLAAAIPAVVVYNVFARSIAGYKALLADTSAEVLRIASRDMDIARLPHGQPAIAKLAAE